MASDSVAVKMTSMVVDSVTGQVIGYKDEAGKFYPSKDDGSGNPVVGGPSHPSVEAYQASLAAEKTAPQEQPQAFEQERQQQQPQAQPQAQPQNYAPQPQYAQEQAQPAAQPQAPSLVPQTKKPVRSLKCPPKNTAPQQAQPVQHIQQAEPVRYAPQRPSLIAAQPYGQRPSLIQADPYGQPYGQVQQAQPVFQTQPQNFSYVPPVQFPQVQQTPSYVPPPIAAMPAPMPLMPAMMPPMGGSYVPPPMGIGPDGVTPLQGFAAPQDPIMAVPANFGFGGQPVQAFPAQQGGDMLGYGQPVQAVPARQDPFGFGQPVQAMPAQDMFGSYAQPVQAMPVRQDSNLFGYGQPVQAMPFQGDFGFGGQRSLVPAPVDDTNDQPAYAQAPIANPHDPAPPPMAQAYPGVVQDHRDQPQMFGGAQMAQPFGQMGFAPQQGMFGGMGGQMGASMGQPMQTMGQTMGQPMGQPMPANPFMQGGFTQGQGLQAGSAVPQQFGGGFGQYGQPQQQ